MTEVANAVMPFEQYWALNTTPFPTELLSLEDAKALAALVSNPESLAFALTSAMNNTKSC